MAQLDSAILDGIQVMVAALDDSAELKQLGSVKAVFVLALPKEAEDERVIHAFEATLPHADSYVLYYAPGPHIQRNDAAQDADVEPDSVYDLPRVVQSRVHLDVPYEFAKDWECALQSGWKQAGNSGALVAVTTEHGVSDTLDFLKRLSRTTSPDTESAPPRATQIDADTTTDF